MKKENWTRSKAHGCVITDTPDGLSESTGHRGKEVDEYYGGAVVCESIMREKDILLITAAPDMLAALIEISEGRGRYNEDRLIHAENTIEDMKQLAKEAIKLAIGKEQGGEG